MAEREQYLTTTGGAIPYYVSALADSVSWRSTPGAAYTLQYSFGVSHEGGSLFGAAARAAAQRAMTAWSNVAQISFASVANAEAELTFSQSDLGTNIAGLTSGFYTGSQLQSSEVQVDTAYNNFSVGSYGYLVMVHELGHAIGLKHPGDYGTGEPGPYLSDAEDSYSASLMSYIPDGLVNDARPATGPMLYDVAAAQYIYGANNSYNSGNTTYSFTSTQQAYALWDGGGTDMVSAAAYSASVTIDLREGLQNISQIGTDRLWMAFGANIENAEGGNAADLITGNALANSLLGRGGVDTIIGGIGNDTIIGGVAIADPTDAGDSLVGGVGSDVMYGNGGADTMLGGIAVADPSDSADTMYGGGGADEMYGNGGADSISGGGSSVDPNDTGDTLYGGGGADTILGNGGNDSICGGGSAVDPNDVGDVILGGRGNDYILGNGGADTINGGEDNDTMHGGVGNDTYVIASGGGADVVLLFENSGSGVGDIFQIERNINHLVVDDASDIVARISYSSGNAFIDVGEGFSVTVMGVAANSFTPDDFAIV
jgi:serralysin